MPNCASIVGGYVCTNIEDLKCCYKEAKTWNSVKVISPLGNAEWIEPYSQQGTNYCALSLRNDPAPGCYDDGELVRIGGGVWYENPEIGGVAGKKKKRDRILTHVEADSIFLVVGAVEWRLDVDSEEGREYEGLTTQSERMAFMKEHGSSMGPSRS